MEGSGNTDNWGQYLEEEQPWRPGEVKSVIVKVAVQFGCMKLEMEMGSTSVLTGRSGHESLEEMGITVAGSNK